MVTPRVKSVYMSLLSSADEGPLKVLLVGGGDLRHILTTLATTSRHIHVGL